MHTELGRLLRTAAVVAVSAAAMLGGSGAWAQSGGPQAPESPSEAEQREATTQPAPPAETHTAVRTTAEFGKGVTFATENDAFSVNMRARIQLRATLLGAPPDSDELPLTEFQARRVRLLFQGHVLSREWQYYLQLGFSNRDTESDLRLPLRDAYLTWTGLRDLNVRMGQMKVPFTRQRVVSSSALQMTERSIVQEELNLDRDVGVQLLSSNLLGLNNLLGYNLGVFSGDGRNRLATGYGLLYVARLQVTPFGKFDDFVESDVERLPRPRLAVGAAAAYNQRTNRERSTVGNTYTLGGFDYAHATADVMFKYSGLSLQGEALWRRAVGEQSREGTRAGQPITEWSRSGWGYFVQGGYLFPNKHLEVSGRYGQFHPLAQTDPALTQNNELGAGLSWYFQEHALKLQSDYFYLYGDAFEEGRHQARVQMQLYF